MSQDRVACMHQLLCESGCVGHFSHEDKVSAAQNKNEASPSTPSHGDGIPAESSTERDEPEGEPSRAAVPSKKATTSRHLSSISSAVASCSPLFNVGEKSASPSATSRSYEWLCPSMSKQLVSSGPESAGRHGGRTVRLTCTSSEAW